MRATTSPPVQGTWSQEWAMQKAGKAVRHLAENYPECAGSEALDPYHDAVHEAAVAEDRDAYKEALREYMRAGRREALKIRKRAA